MWRLHGLCGDICQCLPTAFVMIIFLAFCQNFPCCLMSFLLLPTPLVPPSKSYYLVIWFLTLTPNTDIKLISFCIRKYQLQTLFLLCLSPPFETRSYLRVLYVCMYKRKYFSKAHVVFLLMSFKSLKT